MKFTGYPHDTKIANDSVETKYITGHKTDPTILLQRTYNNTVQNAVTTLSKRTVLVLI